MRKTALITGATSGIGEACARKFAQGGYDVIITGRNKQRLAALKMELETGETKVLALAFETVPQPQRLLRVYRQNGQR